MHLRNCIITIVSYIFVYTSLLFELHYIRVQYIVFNFTNNTANTPAVDVSGVVTRSTGRAGSSLTLDRVSVDFASNSGPNRALDDASLSIEAGEFPSGSVGAYLKEAIAISRSQRRGQVGPNNADPALQDDSYDEGEERSA